MMYMKNSLPKPRKLWLRLGDNIAAGKRFFEPLQTVRPDIIRLYSGAKAGFQECRL